MTNKKIHYVRDRKISGDDFVNLLKKSTLDQRRPVNDPERIKKMLEHGNILITAWDGNNLVGISRALTDFAFCCYLSDLAVDESYQKQGIGKRLVEETKAAAGDHAQLILLAAPAAVNYYPKIGMQKFEHCFLINRKS